MKKLLTALTIIAILFTSCSSSTDTTPRVTLTFKVYYQAKSEIDTIVVTDVYRGGHWLNTGDLRTETQFGYKTNASGVARYELINNN